VKLTPKLLPLSIGLAVGAPLTVCLQAGKYGNALVLLVLGSGWLLGVYYRRPWMGSLCATGVLGMLLVGGLSAWSPTWLLIGVLGLLAAWDMEHFRHRYRLAERVETEEALERRHLGRLAVVLAAGGGLAGLALTVRLHLSFGLALLLMLLVAFGLARLVTRLRRQSD
jgi:hypothetical protein